MDLIIVESPKKAKTIESYLKKQYKVLASNGHVIDLPKKGMGIDVEQNFIPKFETIPGKQDVLDKLKAAAKKAKIIYLATDPDREGEAIAFHIKEYFLQNGIKSQIKRLAFHEITKTEIEKAFSLAGEINQNLVESQITRRIIDRLMGFHLSPFLWRLLKNYRLSAGRVQSVALRFICERENEIDAFIPKIYFELKAFFEKEDLPFDALLHSLKGKKAPFEDKKTMEDYHKSLSKIFIVDKVEKKQSKVSTRAPFTTSVLQREAFNNFRYPASRTMQIAQKLYEGVNYGGGITGLITYMRTDSVRVSNEAMKQNREFIQKNYPNLLSPSPKMYSNKKNKKVQDAHEAIRPVDVYLTPEKVKNSLTADEFKIYSLIWKRFVASQMKESLYADTKVLLKAGDGIFEVRGKRQIFEGFEAVYPNRVKETLLPDFKEGEELKATEIKLTQKETSPPPRYSDASMIEKMERTGVGRPSTYAPTLKTLVDRQYAEREKTSLKPTALGRVVNAVLSENFDPLTNANFTAFMEDDLDQIVSNDSSRLKVLKNFYQTLTTEIAQSEQKIADNPDINYFAVLKDFKEKAKIVTDILCPQCGKNLIVRKGKFGAFLGCEGYPECKYTQTYDPDGDNKTKEGEEGKPKIGSNEPVYREEPCPNCGKRMVRRKSRFGFFWGCEGYPECKTLESLKKPKKASEKKEKAEEEPKVKKTTKTAKTTTPKKTTTKTKKASTSKKETTTKKETANKKVAEKKETATKAKTPAKKVEKKTEEKGKKEAKTPKATPTKKPKTTAKTTTKKTTGKKAKEKE